MPIRSKLTRPLAISPNDLTSHELTMIAEFDIQRRLVLLRFIVPGLLLLLAISIPGILFSSGASLATMLQLSAGLITLTLALWATITRHANVASFALLIGITLRSMLVILFDGPLQGAMKPATMSDFFLLLLPIIIAGVFTEPRIVAATSCVCLIFTVGLFIFVPVGPEMQQNLRDPANAVMIVLPIVIPILIGFLTFVGTRGFRRMQMELATVRVAYEREKELERLRELFISNVNHELRTPIMALQGYLALAEELGTRGDAPSQLLMIQEGRHVARDLGQLVKSVLNVRQVKADTLALQQRECVFQDLVMATLTQLDRWNIHQKNRDIRLDIPPKVLVFVDEQRVQEVLANLLSNAMKYSDKASPIDVSAHLLPGVAKTSSGKNRGSSLATDEPTAMLEVAIRDYGLGIPPDQIPFLFEPFVRLERDIASAVQGTGLGLAICRTYVQAMGGDITVASSGVAGEGSTFRFTLPLARLAH